MARPRAANLSARDSRMTKSRLEAFSDGVLAVIYMAVALIWLVPDRRIERRVNDDEDEGDKDANA